MITYVTKIDVLLDGKKVGEIRPSFSGFAYFPKRDKIGGQVYKTVEEVKFSLEHE